MQRASRSGTFWQQHAVVRAAHRLGVVLTLVAGALTLRPISAAAQKDVDQVAAHTAAVPVPVLRRLTRVEYANSLRDLFGIDFPYTSELPVDGQAAGFDNIGDALSLSPVLLESYLKVARKFSDMVLGTGSSAPLTGLFPVKDSQSSWHDGVPIGTRGGASVQYYFPRRGEYELRAVLDNQLAGLDISTPLTMTEGVRLFKVRATVSEGPHTFIATFPENNALPEGSVPNLDGPGGPGWGGPVDIRASAIRPTIQLWLDGKIIETFQIGGPTISEAADAVQPGPPILGRIEITGPFNPAAKVDTEVKRRLFVCTPRTRAQEPACASKILTPIARRAYRREVTSEDMAPILSTVAHERETGSFEQSIGMGLREILMSPDFLFKVEQAPLSVTAGQIYDLSEYELATRLSYFIWSSLPDEQLLDAAKHNGLRDDVIFERQVRRLLADRKSQALVDNFAMQWLGLRDFENVRPDAKLFPEFSRGLGRAFAEETRLFLRAMAQENRSVLDIISSDYTFLNERLAEFYGIPGVKGPAFRKVKLPSEIEGQRGGLVGQASILMVTSHAAQTSPVLRGKWVLTNLLNRPPHPPPPGVPPLNTKPGQNGRALTTREQIERHQISPVCMACHSKMDPYGLALENYDVMGRWRALESGSPVDASAKLPGGATFVGPEGLKKVLLARSDDFVSATVDRLMTYALGRQLEKSDEEVVKQIVESAKPGGYRFADLVIGITRCAPFRTSEAQLLTVVKE